MILKAANDNTPRKRGRVIAARIASAAVAVLVLGYWAGWPIGP
jgi:hypothetical protein